MKLSEAMMLGSATCKMIPYDLNTCALGAAANAVGIPSFSDYWDSTGRSHRFYRIMATWPWLNNTGYYAFIADLFDLDVCKKRRMTIEQLADYVRSVEPECGECNQFTCVCATPKLIQEQPESVEANMAKAVSRQ